MKKIYFLTAMLFLTMLSIAQNNIDNSFFEKVNYRGAFGTSDWTTGWANYDPQNAVYASATVTIAAGNISANTTWTADKVYLLNGFVYVKSGVTLTIEAGTVIRGDKTLKGTLIVEMGAKLIAEGTAANPIVFTSNQAAGSRNLGDWGGIILLGKAPINQAGGSALIEGGVGRNYGGTTPNDNSGSLKYVRIEFPGIAFEPNNEINGLTCGGVGNGTTLDYIQVSHSGDDSFEWFGGTVNAKHLIAFKGLDDDFDTDNGYNGMVQFAVSLRDPNIADGAGDSNGFESDNDATGSTNEPFTNAIFSNFSVFGPKATAATTVNAAYARGIYIRRNSRLSVYNSIIAGHLRGLHIKDALTQTAATANSLKIENVIIAGSTSKNFESSFERTYFTNASRHNDTLVNNTDLQLVDPFNQTAPNFLAQTGSPVLKGSIWDIAKSISFVVNDGAAVISGAKVTIGSTIKTTDATGKAVFEKLVAGTYNYTVEATQYTTKTGSVAIANVDVTETVSLVYIVPAAKITITVNDGTNVLAGAKVSIGTQSVITDGSGEAVFADMQPNTYAYIVELAGYNTTTGSVSISGVDAAKTVSLSIIELEKYSALFVVKNSKTSLPIEGANVTIAGSTIQTDANGFASFGDLTTGFYTYQVEKEDFEQISTTVSIEDKDVVVNVLFKYLKYHIKFMVKEKDANTPVVGAEITIGSTAITTDGLGMATSDAFAAGNYTYEITKTGYESMSSDIELVDDDVEVNADLVLIVSVAENANQSISLYPNPVNSELFISSSQQISSVIIYNVTGQVVLQSAVNANKVDVSVLNKGLYFISLNTADGKVQSYRIVKE